MVCYIGKLTTVPGDENRCHCQWGRNTLNNNFKHTDQFNSSITSLLGSQLYCNVCQPNHIYNVTLAGHACTHTAAHCLDHIYVPHSVRLQQAYLSMDEAIGGAGPSPAETESWGVNQCLGCVPENTDSWLKYNIRVTTSRNELLNYAVK